MSKNQIAAVVAVVLAVAGSFFAIDFKSAVCGAQSQSVEGKQ